MRGLTSNRAGARHGFAVAFTALLRQAAAPDPAQIVTALEDATQVTGSIRGQRERDFYFGRLFGYMCFIRAGYVSRHPALGERFVESALTLAAKKAWLAELCHEVVADVLRASSKEQILSKLLPSIAKSFEARAGSKADAEALLPEQLGLLFVTFERVGVEGADTLPVVSVVEQCLSKRKHAEVAWAMLVAPLRRACSTCPRLHSVWAVVVSALLKSGKPRLLVAFWNVVVEKGLLQSTHERKYTAMALFVHVIEGAATSGMLKVIVSLLTKPFLTCLMNNAAADDRYLHAPAVAVLEKIVQVLVTPAGEVGDREGLELIRTQVVSILINKGYHRFDQRTRTKTIASLLSGLDKKRIELHVKSLKDQISKEQDTSVRKGLLDAFYAATKACTDLRERKEVLVSVGEFLFDHAFVRGAQSEEERKFCANRLMALIVDASTLEFAHLKKLKRVGDKTKSQSPKERESNLLVLRLWDSWMNGVGTSGLDVSCKLGEAEKFCFQAGSDAIAKMAKVEGDLAIGLRLLLCLVLFQIVLKKAGDVDDTVEVDLVEIAQDITTCAENLCLKRSDLEDAEDIPVLIDAILALLSQPSAYIRSVTKTAFALVSSVVDQQALDVLLEALLAKQGLEKAEEEAEDDAQEEGAEVEEFQPQQEANKKGGGDSEGEKEPEESIDDSDGTDTANEETSMDAEEVVEALVAAAPAESEVEHNAEMDGYDKALVAYLKQRVGAFKGKAGILKLRCQSIHFRQKVLDLVEVLCNFQPKSHVLVLLPCAFLEASVSCLKTGGVFETGVVGNESRALFKRLGSIQRKLYHSKELPQLRSLQHVENSAGVKALMGFQADTDDSGDQPEGPLDGEDQVCALLKSVIRLASKAGNADVAALTAEAANFAIRLGKQLSHFLLSSGLFKEIYLVAIQECMQKRHSKIPFKFLEDVIVKHENYGWELVPLIAEQTVSGCRTSFQRCEGLRLLSVALHRLPDKKKFQRTYPVVVNALNAAVEDAVTKKDEGLLKGKRPRVLLQLCLDLNRALSKLGMPTAFADAALLSNVKKLEAMTTKGGIKAKAKQFLNLQDQGKSPTDNSQGSSQKRKASDTKDEKTLKKKKKSKMKKDGGVKAT